MEEILFSGIHTHGAKLVAKTKKIKSLPLNMFFFKLLRLKFSIDIFPECCFSNTCGPYHLIAVEIEIWPFQPPTQQLQSPLRLPFRGGGEATDRPGRPSALPTEPRSASDSPLPPRHAPARRRWYFHRPVRTASSTLPPRPRSAKGFF